MKKIALLAAVAGGLLALAGPAQAKEIVSLKICGASGCTEIKDHDSLSQWMPEGDPVQVARTRPAAFYSLDVVFGDPEGNVIHSETAYWLPGSNVMQYKGQLHDPWWKLVPTQVAMLRKASSGMDPFTPRLDRVRVGGKKVTDPNSYLRLLGKFGYSTVPAKAAGWTRVTLNAQIPTPWISGTVRMTYTPKTRLLVRPDGYYRLPKALGERLMHRASLAPPGQPQAAGSSGGDTMLYAGVGIAGFAGLAVALLAGRTAVRRKGSNS